MNAPLPIDETRRLEVLEACKVFETEPEAALDCLVAEAAQALDAPVALLTLLGPTTQWFKACYGISGVRETAREISFCAHTILEEEGLVVPDLAQDPRFEDNPLVTGWPNARFYAGYTLRTHDGYALGALCVADTQPRPHSSDALDQLRRLGQRAVEHLERRRDDGPEGASVHAR